tara:strand:- start:4338 stop:5453 length:1116 start_codon:yes stop_codon:yes gene_type:complete
MVDNREKAFNECLEILDNPCKSILLLSPRVGKSRIGIGYIKLHQLKKILWVTPTVKLRDEDIPDEFIKWKAKKHLPGATIVCYSSLAAQEGKYDLVILDEIQAITEANAKPLLNGKIKTKSILGLTGTMPKHEEKLKLIKQLGLKIEKEITIDEAVEDNMIADYKVNVLEVPMDAVNKNIKAGTKDKPFMTTEAANYAYLSKNIARMMFNPNKSLLQFAILKRLRFIYTSPTKLSTAKKLLNYLDGRKLIFTGSIDHAEQVSKHTYHSKTTRDDLNLFLDGKVDVLACVNAGGTGFTYTNVDHFIIVQADSNKSGGFIQKLARSLLLQKDYTASIWVITLQGSQDEVWVTNALAELDSSKIEYVNIKNLKL